MKLLLPRAGAPIIQGDGKPTTEHYQWCARITNAVNEAAVPATEEEAAPADPSLPLNTLALGLKSVQHYGSLADGQVSFALRGDVTAPGINYVYGTNAAGERGWRQLATTDDLPEGPTNLYHTAARVDARIALAAPKGYIDGLQMQWVSGAALTVSSGAAYIEASGKIVSAPSAIAKTGLSLSASTWYHVYLYLNAGVPDVEIVTTAPVAYNGTARSKTGDTSRRYVGSVLTAAGGAVLQFAHIDSDVWWVGDTSVAPLRILANGLATARTAVSAATAIPVTAASIKINAINIAATANLFFGSAAGAGDSMKNFASSAGTRVSVNSAVDGSQQIAYFLDAASANGAYFDVAGYGFGR